MAFNRTNPAVIDAMRAKYGLDQPILQQYISYLARLLRFDLGISSSYAGKSVNVIIADTFPISLRISLISTFIGGLFGIIIAGIISITKKRWLKVLCRIMILMGISASAVIIAPALQLIFGVQLRWLPVGLLLSPKYYVLPVASLALATSASVSYIASHALKEIKRSTYYFVAKQKGFSDTYLFFKYALRNISVPLVNHLAVCFASNTIGCFFLESVYTIPGIGSIMMNAVNSLDYGLIMGLTVFFGGLFIGIILIMDLICSLIDPRIQLAK